MKLRFASGSPCSQPDPFIFEDAGRYYLYVTAERGVEAYSADSPFGLWAFEGIVATVPQGRSYWAPCILRLGDGRDWHTIEGPFWFREGAWQYVMYSGGCFLNDTYHIGYAAAKSDEPDLTKVDFVKHTADGAFAPVMARNAVEEGVGHHSVIRIDGVYYAVYHGRDLDFAPEDIVGDRRTARICRLRVADGVIVREE